MKTNDFHLIVQRDRVLLSWGNQQEVPYRLAGGLEKDRLVARILHKVLNMRLAADETGFLGRDEFKVLGATLFKLLFNDDSLKIHFGTFYKEALGSSPNDRYRLILEFDREADEVATLPWEYLYYEEDETHEAFLAAHPKKCIDFLRKVPFKNNWLELDKTKQQVELSLRVLVIISQPNTAMGANAQEEELLVYFEGLEERFSGQAEIRILRQPEVDIFEQQLQKEIYGADSQSPFFPHVVHFVGRSRVSEGVGQICFVKKGNGVFLENWINEETFAGYFEEWERLPYLVFLHICDGIRINDYKTDKGIALRLVRKGIPFVIALQNPISEWIAQILTEKIYDQLMAGFDIAAAATEARWFLARKLIDANSNKYDNYAHKAFGSVLLLTSVLTPFTLTFSADQQTTAVYKTCPNHPQLQFILSATRCNICNTSLTLPSENTAIQKSDTRTGRTSADIAAVREASSGSGAQATTASQPTPTVMVSAMVVDSITLVKVKANLKESMRDSLEKCFDKFFAILVTTTISYNKLITYESDFKSAKDRFFNNLIKAEDELIARSKVQRGLLDLIDSLQEKDILMDALKRLGIE